MIQHRDESASKAARRSMAQLLESGKVASARIRVENIIRTDILIELHEILELYCELLIARAGLLDSPVCDPGLEEAVKSIMYAAPKTEIKELQTVRLLLAEKYGKEFLIAAMENTDGKVSEKVVKKLMVTPPRDELIQGYLEEIAKAYGVDWPPGRLRAEAAAIADNVPETFDVEDEASGGGGGGEAGDGGDDDVVESIEGAGDTGEAMLTPSKPKPRPQDDIFKATPPKAIRDPASPLTVTPPRMTSDNIHPKVTLNSQEIKPKSSAPAPAAPRSKAAAAGKGGVEDLEARFAALKKLGPP
jgi:vacuolar protein sorting-associated protein IST1